MIEVVKLMGIPVIVHAPTLFGTSTRFLNVIDAMATHVIITDHIGARGLEVASLLITFNPNEPYLQHYVVEALTRCVSQLYFVVMDKKEETKKEKRGILEMIITKWKKIRNQN